jgi:hypothetical protein
VGSERAKSAGGNSPHQREIGEQCLSEDPHFRKRERDFQRPNRFLLVFWAPGAMLRQVHKDLCGLRLKSNPCSRMSINKVFESVGRLLHSVDVQVTTQA